MAVLFVRAAGRRPAVAAFAAAAAAVAALVVPGSAVAAGAAQPAVPSAAQPPVVQNAAQAAPPVYSDAAALGKLLFNDPALSASGRMSCATCHSPSHAYGPPNGLAAQFGGPDLRSQGTRAVPTLRYVLNRTPRWVHVQASSFAERVTDADAAPTGGFTWDGRFNRLQDQATFPLFNPNEMANRDPVKVVAQIEHAPYGARFRQVFGDTIFATPAAALRQAMYAIERFQLEDPSFHPYTSKFDYYLDGKVQLSAAELRGKRLFDDPTSGNCASCHLDQSGVNGAHPLFTDYTFEALGVPRNPELRANRDPAYYDEGLCGPLRTDVASNKAYCGLFKTPTLRNVATRAVFFHNGRFHTLRDALRFYVERDTDPAKWYPKDAHGRVQKFDDLPVALRVNVDTTDEPLTRKAGGRPAWNERDIDDVIAFLKTLNDDYPLDNGPHAQKVAGGR
ncbi:cytochrome-c peroxidase [Paraburkholderia caballeronis]|uniref:Cytochrome c peroxidase n=1 Tax=Paraburkholderia caballeronis TaxID=416943 RepID=A0A1H7U0D9_9BURK|nr:cytochrome c peroxidase [Paraburkholderia caballeronis]PXW23447.1 cytochrome c peroxidase [Paraburkholderia caballeronis]PXW98440.1 cytochrome c peroxidase [Paraburkholderia caballeronis]RAJ95171.1 cytochrome c peroxidase [Paraburkholderia caballeronis]SEC52912.1 cytochrome c peroxidase [Paraburkholderia caballeronis]SEL90582.1 cytochrome c peroxidase [Paraburkholderia caballeronis]